MKEGSKVAFITKHGRRAEGIVIQENHHLLGELYCLVLAQPFGDGQNVNCIVKKESLLILPNKQIN